MTFLWNKFVREQVLKTALPTLWVFSWFLSTSMAATSDAEVSESGRQTK